MNKSEIERKKEFARALFMSGTPQEQIADKVGVSRVTISKWSSAEGWKETRAARNITRPELVNKLLATIDRLIEQVSSSGDDSQLAGLGDKLAKLASVIQKLDKQAGVVDSVEVFMAFNKWLQFRSATDPDVTPELVKAINRLQDKFLTEAINKNSLL
jgi:hypothetical protein